MDIVDVKRNGKEHFTRVTLSDGSYEDFKPVRGAIVFPFQKAPGVILIGGLCRESETIKILAEREFVSLSVAASELLELKSRFLIFQFYYQNIPESEGPAEYLQSKTDLSSGLVPAPHSEDFEYGVLLINEYLGADRLSVPQNGILTNQLTVNWENINADNRPHAVAALLSLLTGFECFPPDRVIPGKGFFTEFDLD